MPKNVALAASVAGMAALGIWMTLRRTNSALAGAALSGFPNLEIDEDREAELIAFYRPALEAALAPARE